MPENANPNRARDHLANERTFLAWVRTGVATIIFGFAIGRFSIALRQLSSLEGHPVRYAAVEDVIVHKLFAGRARDLEDIRGILRRRPALDEAYLQRWLSEFRATSYRDLWHEFPELKAETDRT